MELESQHRARGLLALVGVALLIGAAIAISGRLSNGPRTPPALPGLSPPFFGVAVLGDGRLSAAVDAYGDVVDLRAGSTGRELMENPVERQIAGTVPGDTGIVPRVSVGSERAVPFWQADRVRQTYVSGTNVLRTVARFDSVTVRLEDAARGWKLVRRMEVGGVGESQRNGVPVRLSFHIEEELGEQLDCRQRSSHSRLALVCFAAGELRPMTRNPVRRGTTYPPSLPFADSPWGTALQILRASTERDRRWVARARPLGAGAPAWARTMYERSLLVLRALTDRRTGGVAAGARDGWAFVWPRDAATAALALSSAGYGPAARRIAGFLLNLDLNAAARFEGAGDPIEGREAQGDAWGWAARAARATGLLPPVGDPIWKERADYQEKSSGIYLGNALASVTPLARPGHKRVTHPKDGEAGEPEAFGIKMSPVRQREIAAIRELFGSRGVLTREAKAPGSAVDSVAAWAVRPFALPALYPAARRSLLRLIDKRGGRFGVVPSEDWPEDDPWSAPTAWTAWAFAALPDGRPTALRLLASLRRAATSTGMLPERVDAHTGVPRSTTPLAWAHTFVILALRELWPGE